MHFITILLFIFFTQNALASGIITCGDAFSVGSEAKKILHLQAQKRAQKDIQEFMEKEVKRPIVNFLGHSSSIENMGKLIETFWCETKQTPLHSAYYSFYASNKYVFYTEKEWFQRILPK